jgi:hypothetical protein
MTGKTSGGLAALIAAAASLATAAGLLASGTAAAAATIPRFRHVVIVIMENKNYGEIIGRRDEAPWLNKLAASGALFSDSFAVSHPSEPNYLALFSGSTQRVTSDACPVNFAKTPNLGAELIGAKLSFTGYAESMPSAGYTGCGISLSFGYVRSHNPWADFANVPAASNLPFSRFPASYGRLPTVSFVVPNLCHDMHSCTRDSGDNWLRHHLGGYAQWALSHNSLLVITWDEDGSILGLGGDHNKIATIFYGAHVRRRTFSERITHYSILRTIEDMYGLARAGASARAKPITDVWK